MWTCEPPARSVPVGDEELLRREEREHAGAAGAGDDALLQPRGGVACTGRAVRLQGEDHTLAQLDRVLERGEPGDDRPLVQAEPEAVAELQAERRHLVVETEILRPRPEPG